MSDMFLAHLYAAGAAAGGALLGIQFAVGVLVGALLLELFRWGS